MKTSDAVKVFQLNDYDWWAGATLESVKASYLEWTGVSEAEAFDNPQELTDKEMSTLRFREEDEDCLPGQEAKTFRQRLNEMVAAGDEFPCFFASTEW